MQNLTVHDVNGSFKEKVNGGIHYRSIGETKPSRFFDLRIENNRIWHVDRSGIFGWSTHWTRSKWYPSLGVVIRNGAREELRELAFSAICERRRHIQVAELSRIAWLGRVYFRAICT